MKFTLTLAEAHMAYIQKTLQHQPWIEANPILVEMEIQFAQQQAEANAPKPPANENKD